MATYIAASRETIELIRQLSHERYIADEQVRQSLRDQVRAHLIGAHRFTVDDASRTIAWLLRRPARRGVRQLTLLAS